MRERWEESFALRFLRRCVEMGKTDVDEMAAVNHLSDYSEYHQGLLLSLFLCSNCWETSLLSVYFDTILLDYLLCIFSLVN